MSTITLPNIRVSSDLTVKLKLKDGGVALDWSTLQNIKVSIYSDAQRALAGRCGASIDAEDPTLLVCTYAANKPQYVGVNRVVVSAKYMGETKTYDKPAFNFVRWTDDQAGEQITIDDPDIDVEIEVEDVSSSILQAAIAAALQAAEDAEHAAHLVPLEVLQDCEQATQDANEAAAAANAAGITSVQVSVEDNEPGTPSAECSLANKVLSVIFHYLKGETGDAAGFGTITATCVEDGGDPSVLVTLSGPDTAKNIAFTLKNFKGDKGDKGDQGNTGSSVDYPFEIVNNCTTDDATKALSAAQGKALKDEVNQLEAKVDDLSTGKYYGYFAQEEDLPEADVDGFAYVGEGPTYTIYNLRGGVWTSSDITVNQSPIGNEEDINQNEDGKLQFADRVSGNGMGYMILRKNKTFASQVTDTNTIYEIRYDFDLNSATVNIPSGCVLRFNGGSISNGTLSGDFSIEAKTEKIFTDVHFSGECVFNQYLVEWFTDTGQDSVSTSYDASAELNAMFSSGIKRLYLTNRKFYYLSSTVTIPGDITISGAPQVLDRASNSSNGITPCFFVSGDTIAFLIECNQSVQDKRSLYMKGIHVWRIDTVLSEGNYKETIPTVKMDVAQQLWGCELELFISSALASVTMTVKDETIKTVSQAGFTGLEIYVHGSGNYLTYAKIGGYMRYLRRGIYIHSDAAAWITGVTLLFDSWCVFGGEVQTATIYGEHQALAHLVNNETLSYFYGSKWIKVYGYFYDLDYLHPTSQLGSVRYSVQTGSDLFMDSANQSRANFKEKNVLPYDFYVPQSDYPNGIGNLTFEGNILEDFFFNNFGPIDGDKFISRTQLSTVNPFRGAYYVDLSNNNVTITKDNITNYDKLFKAKTAFAYNANIKDYLDSSSCYTSTHAKALVATFAAPSVIGSPVFGAVTKDACSFEITIKDSSDVTLFHTLVPTSKMGGFANYVAFFVPCVIFYTNVIEIKCICETSTGYFERDALPKLFLLSARNSNAITPSGGLVGGNLRMANAEFFNLGQMVAGFRQQCNRFVAGEYLLEAVSAVNTEKQILHATVYSFDSRYIHIKCLSNSGEHYIHISQPDGEYRTDFGQDVSLGVYFNYASYRAEFVVTYRGPENVTIIDVIGSGPTKLLSRDADITGFTAATLVTQ